MKAVIVYASCHHKNTEKLVKAVGETLSADIVDILKEKNTDLSEYGLVGFASGIYRQKVHSSISDLIDNTKFLSGQKTFTIITYGLRYMDYIKKTRKKLASKSDYLGNFQCRGFDTAFGLQKIGGIARNRPNDKDIAKAVEFAKSLLLK